MTARAALLDRLAGDDVYYTDLTPHERIIADSLERAALIDHHSPTGKLTLTAKGRLETAGIKVKTRGHTQ